MKRSTGTKMVVPKALVKKQKLGAAFEEESCTVCNLFYREGESNSSEEDWHGCNCGRWYHAACTKLSGETPSDFSCHHVAAKYGKTCTVRKPNEIGKRALFLTPFIKKEVASTKTDKRPGSKTLPQTSPSSSGLQERDLEVAMVASCSSQIHLEPSPDSVTDLTLEGTISDHEDPQNSNFKFSRGAKTRAKTFINNLCETPKDTKKRNNKTAVELVKETPDLIEKKVMSEKQTTSTENKRPWPYCIPPGKKGIQENDHLSDVSVVEPSAIAVSPKRNYTHFSDTDCQSKIDVSVEEPSAIAVSPESKIDVSVEEPSAIAESPERNCTHFSDTDCQSKIDVVIESVVKSSAGVARELQLSTGMDGDISPVASGSKVFANVKQNISRGSSVSDEFRTPIKSKEQFEIEQGPQKEYRSPKKLTNEGIRTNPKRILPSRTIAEILKNVDKKAYRQYCIETDPDPEPEIPKVKRRRQGHCFPTQDEIDAGAKEYDVPKYRSYAKRAPTIMTKVKELVGGAKCADVVVDIIPNFESKSKECGRLTYISKDYFKAADSCDGGQLQFEEIPQPVRASSIELPEILLRPKGPMPDRDTGNLEKPDKDVECDICRVEYGSDADNELADYMLGCWADRFCSTSKMYHLSCYFPQARVICDYEKPEELIKFRELVFCSRTCMLLAKQKESVDEDGLLQGKGRRKKKTADEENED